MQFQVIGGFRFQNTVYKIGEQNLVVLYVITQLRHGPKHVHAYAEHLLVVEVLTVEDYFRHGLEYPLLNADILQLFRVLEALTGLLRVLSLNGSRFIVHFHILLQ